MLSESRPRRRPDAHPTQSSHHAPLSGFDGKRGTHDNDGFVLSAHRGKSQGRHEQRRAHSSSVSTACPTASPKVPISPEPGGSPAGPDDGFIPRQRLRRPSPQQRLMHRSSRRLARPKREERHQVAHRSPVQRARKSSSPRRRRPRSGPMPSGSVKASRSNRVATDGWRSRARNSSRASRSNTDRGGLTTGRGALTARRPGGEHSEAGGLERGP